MKRRDVTLISKADNAKAVPAALLAFAATAAAFWTLRI
jgi:hypothetical protein